MGYFIITDEQKTKASENTTSNVRKVQMDTPVLEDSGIPLNVKEKEVNISNPESHCLICGASGKGKTRRVLYPLVTMSARAGRSMVIADMKGEIYRNTAKEVKKCGLNVKVINLRNPTTGNRYNPFSLIQKYWNQGNHSRASILLKDIVDLLVQDVKSSRDKYWENAAKDVIIGISLLLLERNIPLSFSTITDTFNTIVKADEKREDTWSEESIETVQELKAVLADGPNSGRRLSSWLNVTHPNTKGCINSEVGVVISKYVDQEDIRDLLSYSDINMTDLGKKPTAIYFICPDESTALYDIASLFVEQCYSELIHFADNSEENRLKVKVDFILDEFGSFIGSDWPSKLTAARSRGIRFILALQNLSQLTARYGAENAKTIETNCRTLMFMGGRDLELIATLVAFTKENSPITGQTLMQLKMGDVAILDDAGTTYLGHLPDWTAWNITERASLCTTKRNPAQPYEIDLSSLLNKYREFLF